MCCLRWIYCIVQHYNERSWISILSKISHLYRSEELKRPWIFHIKCQSHHLKVTSLDETYDILVSAWSRELYYLHCWETLKTSMSLHSKLYHVQATYMIYSHIQNYWRIVIFSAKHRFSKTYNFQHCFTYIFTTMRLQTLLHSSLFLEF